MSTSIAIDLSKLPAPTVIESLDFEQIFAQRKAALIALYPEDQRAELAATLALESEPLVMLLQENAYRELLLRQRINEAAQAVMLPYAQGADLENVAALLNVQRLTIQPGNPSAVPPVEPLYESDAALRERAQNAFEQLSTAGPRTAYVMHARAADGRVADASAISPSPATVIITVLAHEGDGTASETLLEKVRLALNDETVRPLGDRVIVQSAQIIPYTVKATLYVHPGPESEPILQAARDRLQNYISRQHRLGASIHRSALFAALHGEGVQNVILHTPETDHSLTPAEAAFCTSVQLDIAQEER